MEKKRRVIKKNEFISFGGSVRKFRTSLGLSQEELAFKTGLDRTYISGVERGIRNISLRNILLIANALKIHPSFLFNIDDENIIRK